MLNAVEFTVTPPGLVVPETNHWATAPFLNPLPLTTTSRLTVPCAALLRTAEVTWICANALGAQNSSATPISRRPNTARARFFIAVPQREIWTTEFLTRMCLSFFRGNIRPVEFSSNKHERGPVKGVPV